MQELSYRYRIKVTKLNELKYISHLDWQNLIIKTFRRMELTLRMSEGFNPTPRISFSPALPIFIESECELIYFETVKEIPNNFRELFKENISENVKLINLVELKREIQRPQPMDKLISWALYTAKPIIEKSDVSIFDKIMYNTEKCLLSNDLFIKKINKKGIEKTINYRKSIHSIEFKGENLEFILKTGQDNEIPALRADDMLNEIYGVDIQFEVRRIKFFDKDFNEI